MARADKRDAGAFFRENSLASEFVTVTDEAVR